MKDFLRSAGLALVTTLLAAGAAAEPGPASIPILQRLALMALYDSTNGSGWTNAANWRTGGTFSPIGIECTWFGVTCNGTPSVTKIELPDNNLTGTIPPELGDFSTLTMLDLSENSIGGEIPSADMYTAARGFEVAAEHAHDGGFTGTIVAEQTDDFAAANSEGHPVHGEVFAVASGQ